MNKVFKYVIVKDRGGMLHPVLLSERHTHRYRLAKKVFAGQPNTGLAASASISARIEGWGRGLGEAVLANKPNRRTNNMKIKIDTELIPMQIVVGLATAAALWAMFWPIGGVA